MAGVLFCLATLPSHAIALPFLGTSWNLLLKGIGLARIEAEINRLSGELSVQRIPGDAELCPEPEA